MKYFYATIFLFLLTFAAFSQCSFPIGATQNGATQLVCVAIPAQSYDVTNVKGNNFISLNVIQGFTYRFSVENVYASNSENLNIFNTSNVNIGFSSGASGTSIDNWIAPFSGQIKIVLSFDACNSSNTSDNIITISLLSVGNTLDNQNAMGVNTWVGHAYNWIDTTLPLETIQPPGGNSPATPSATMPFNPENYIGYYNYGTESISENFGGNSVCFPLLSNGSNIGYVNTETFAFRYKMRSTRAAGCYMAKIKGDAGTRLYVDNKLVFNEWKRQSTEYVNIFIYLDGDAELILDYYDDYSNNILEFSLANFVTTTNTISFVGSSPVCNNVAPGVMNGSSYSYFGSTSNPTIAYQWQVSNDNFSFTNIAGATSEDYSPPGTTSAGIRYYRRIVSPAASITSCSYSSNVIAIETYLAAQPAQPVLLDPTNLTCSSFDANWNSVSGVVNYLLYVSTDSSFTTVLPSYNGLNVGNVTSFTISGLNPTVLYYYRIQAVTSCLSKFSVTNSFIFLGKPGRPSMTPISCDSFVVNWNLQPRADSYVLDVSNSSSFSTFIPGYNGLNVGNITSHTLSGLPVGLPIYFRIRAFNNVCGQSSNSNLNSNITSWAGSSWSNGSPDFTRYVFLIADYDMTTLPSFDACSLELRNGVTLTISDGKSVNVENEIFLQTSGLIKVLNNGSLVQIADGVTNTGNISLERTTQLRLFDYVYWSSPVRDFPVLNVSPNTPSNLILNWNTVAANPNGGQGNWQTVNQNMIAGKGYAIRGPIGFNNVTPQNFTATFNGVPNNGVISFPIQKGSNIGAGSNGPNGVLRTINDDNWNLIGNPYPSSIDVLSFLSSNPNLDGNVRIWTSTSLPSDITTDPFYNDFQYNYSPNDYIVHNGTATTSGPGSFNGYISSGQSFMVMMDEAFPSSTSTVVFNNSMRSKTYDNSQFYRNSQSNNEKHRIWLDLISNVPSGTVSRTVIGYVDGATDGKDRLFDAVTSYKLSQNLYSVLDNDILCIQGKSLPFLDSDVISLGFKASVNGSYTIAIAAVDGIFDSGQIVYLEDKLTNVIHDLSQSAYVFNSNSGIFNNRFVLRYSNSILSNPDFNMNSVLIYTENTSIHINSGDELIASYEVYDLLGRILISEKNVSSNQVTTELQQSSQALIIKVKLANNQVITKKIIH